MVKRIIYCITILFFQLVFLKTEAQNGSKVSKRTSLSLQIYGPEVLGVYTNYYFNNRVSINAGLGFNLDAHLGSNYYLTDRSSSRSSFFVGAQITTIREFFIFKSATTVPKREMGLFFPFGYEYFTKNGFIFHADVGIHLIRADWSQINTFPVLGSMKLGYLFNKKD